MSEPFSADASRGADPAILRRAIRDLGRVLGLIERSPMHFLHPAHVLFDRIFPSLLNGQHRLWERDGQASAFVNWAWLSPAVAEKFATAHYHLSRDEWNCGPELWFCEVIAQEGEIRAVTRDLKRDLMPPGTRARWLRIGPSGDLHGIGEFRTPR